MITGMVMSVLTYGAEARSYTVAQFAAGQRVVNQVLMSISCLTGEMMKGQCNCADLMMQYGVEPFEVQVRRIQLRYLKTILLVR